MRLLSLFVYLFIISTLPHAAATAHEIDPTRPMMLDDDNYTEYWEQYLYLDDGSLITSQFLVANFPWPVGKEHGIMLGTLVTPEGELYVIKNGRDLGEWGFSENGLDVFIHTHRLKGENGKYSLHLENTMGIADLDLTGAGEASHNGFSSDNGFMESRFYAPVLRGSGNWQLGPEAGFDPAGPVHNAGFATGFGVRVLMTDKVDQLIDNWTRVVGVAKDGPTPFLSAIDRPNGDQDIIFQLTENGEKIDEFGDVKISYEALTQEKDARYPKEVRFSAKGENGLISGTIRYAKKFNHFNLTDHLNFFEKSFAKSNPDITNFRYLADYELLYKTDEGVKVFTGKALSEYTDVQPAKKAPAKKRRRNRR